jgi:hypothetical protein
MIDNKFVREYGMRRVRIAAERSDTGGGAGAGPGGGAGGGAPSFRQSRSTSAPQPGAKPGPSVPNYLELDPPEDRTTSAMSLLPGASRCEMFVELEDPLTIGLDSSKG